MTKANTTKPPKTPKTAKERTKAVTARSWARDLGYEKEWQSLDRDARYKAIDALKITKKRDRVIPLAEKAEARLAAAAAKFDAQKALAVGQIARRDAIFVADRDLKEVAETLQKVREALASKAAPTTPAAAPTA